MSYGTERRLAAIEAAIEATVNRTGEPNELGLRQQQFQAAMRVVQSADGVPGIDKLRMAAMAGEDTPTGERLRREAYDGFLLLAHRMGETDAVACIESAIAAS